MFERVWNDHFKKYPQFQVSFSKIDVCIHFYFFTFPKIFPLQIQCVCVCVCVCAYLLCSNCIYNLCTHASCNFLYGHAIQCDIKEQGLKKWGCIGWKNFSPRSRICDITRPAYLERSQIGICKVKNRDLLWKIGTNHSRRKIRQYEK